MKVQPQPDDTCLHQGCGVRFEDHDELDHEFFCIYRVGSWWTDQEVLEED
jgi:hypothetical protein